MTPPGHLRSGPSVLPGHTGGWSAGTGKHSLGWSANSYRNVRRVPSRQIPNPGDLP